MPKASPIQATFSAGEISPLVQGRVDSERYKTALDTCLNYIPTLQGPLVRRPGTKNIVDVKDPSKPPTLIPFKFSANQNYMLEFGNQYIRFYTNEGQMITNTTVFKVGGIIGFNTALFTQLTFNALRPDINPINADEGITSSSVVTPGSVLELVSPYQDTDAPNIKYTQSGDVLYLAHSSFVTYKLQRFGQYSWTLKPIIFQDGPLLPFNSYKTISDSARVTLTPSNVNFGTLSTGPNYLISGAADNGAGAIRITTSASNTYASGDKVCVRQIVGTTEANNGTSTIQASYWSIKVIDATHFDLVGSAFSNAYVSGGTVAPALFELFSINSQVPPVFADATSNKLRNFSLIQDGYRYWGVITGVSIPSSASYFMYSACSAAVETKTWQMGKWNLANGFPSAICLHQDRLALSGAPAYPQDIDLSKAGGDYENFAAAGSTYAQVTDASACKFKLASAESNPIRWLKSSAQGLLAGSATTEWQLAPNNLNAALTPTNVSAAPTSFYGSANVDSVQAGNATLYVQGAYRKVRELNYFFQVGTFRSTDLSELSEHITTPTVTRLAVQKEPLPLVWGLRSDGVLVSMSYNRDDQTIKAGWARHILGGQSDSGGTPAQVKSIAVMTASSTTFDQLWMVTKRFINGTSVVSVEVMTQPYNDSMPQEDGYCLDNGITFDQPKAITGLTNVGSAVVTCVSHGFNNGSSILITDLVGLNLQSTDIDGNVSTSNLVNEKTFVVASTTANTFYLQDFSGSFINASSYSSYVSGGSARKHVTRISGLTWLKGETLGVVADGGIHPDVVVNSGGAIALSYPAAKVQLGYRYNSDGARLRSEAGAADGTSVGKLRRITYVAFLLHKVADFSFGPEFTRLLPAEFVRGDANQADIAPPLFSGLTRDGLEAGYDLDDRVCWRQNSGLPGMVQSVTVMVDEFDV
jgi:hypothetical protein